MSSPVPVAPGGEVVERLVADLSAVRDLIAPKASAAELRVFAQVAASLDLDPFAGQICLVGRWNKDAGREVHRHQITVDGRRAIAQRTGKLEGILGPMWSGPRDDLGALNWREVWDDDQLPYCARTLVYVSGWKMPANGTAKWSEFAQRDRDGGLIPTWAKMPSHMLGKVSEALALRRAFPEVAAAISYAGAWPPDEDGLEQDDAATVAEATTEPTPVRVAPPAGPPSFEEMALTVIRDTIIDEGLIPTGGPPPLAGPNDDVQLRLIRALLDQLNMSFADLVALTGIFASEPETMNTEQRRIALDRLKEIGRARAQGGR